jgi:hypothetical protein
MRATVQVRANGFFLLLAALAGLARILPLPRRGAGKSKRKRFRDEKILGGRIPRENISQ